MSLTDELRAANVMWTSKQEDITVQTPRGDLTFPGLRVIVMARGVAGKVESYSMLFPANTVQDHDTHLAYVLDKHLSDHPAYLKWRANQETAYRLAAKSVGSDYRWVPDKRPESPWLKAFLRVSMPDRRSLVSLVNGRLRWVLSAHNCDDGPVASLTRAHLGTALRIALARGTKVLLDPPANGFSRPIHQESALQALADQASKVAPDDWEQEWITKFFDLLPFEFDGQGKRKARYTQVGAQLDRESDQGGDQGGDQHADLSSPNSMTPDQGRERSPRG